MSRHIAQDGQALEDCEIVAVVVDDGRNSPVRRDFREPGLFLDILADVDPLVDVVFAIGGFELFEQDVDFVAVRGSPGKNWRGELAGPSLVRSWR